MRVALGRAPRGRADAWHRVESDGRDVAARLVSAVNEALFLLYTRRQACVAMRWDAGHAVIGGARLPAGVEPETEVKAATFHALHPRLRGRRLHAVLVLDV
jgi:SHS2 domain-containing protein